MDRYKLEDWPNYALFFSLLMGYTYYAYSFSFNSPWFFDDYNALTGLSQIHSIKDAINYIISGVTGLLGRPISSATFLFNIEDWPNNPAGFRILGTCYHLLNGLLLLIVAYRFALLLPKLIRTPRLFSSLLFGLWLLHPIHFTATLMPIQRMTLVSATFVLLGLLGYLSGRTLMETANWKLGLRRCSLSLILCSIFGVLAKENGGLLPFFVAVIEIGLLKRYRPQVKVPCHLWRYWQILFFIAPMLLLIAYLGYLSTDFIKAYEFKSFNLSERLTTQAVILWDYLRLIFAPIPRYLGPYHDDYPIFSINSWAFLVAILLWLVALGSSIKYYRKCPWLFAAFAWYLLGHILESTIVPLELYFEHRNYIPSIGPLAVLAGWLLQVVDRVAKTFDYFKYNDSLTKHLYSLGLYLPLLVMMLLLWNTTALWGNTIQATAFMTEQHPGSVRAAQQLASATLATNDIQKTQAIIAAAAKRIPASSSLHLSNLQLLCAVGDPQQQFDAYKYIIEHGATMEGSNALVPILVKITQMATQQQCGSIHPENVLTMINAFSENDKIIKNGKINYKLFYLAGDIYLQQDNKKKALNSFLTSISFRRTPLNIMQATTLLYSQESAEKALQFLDEHINELPVEDLRVKSSWGPQVKALRNQLCSVVSHC